LPGPTQEDRAASIGNLPIGHQADRAVAAGISLRTQRKLDRLARERPDLLDEVRSGRLSAHGAALAAGIVKPPEPYQQMCRLWAKILPGGARRGRGSHRQLAAPIGRRRRGECGLGVVGGMLSAMAIYLRTLPPGNRCPRFPRPRFMHVHEVIEPARVRMEQSSAKRYGERHKRVLDLIDWNRRSVGCGPHLGVFCWGMETEFFPRVDPIETYYPYCRYLLQTAQMEDLWQSPAYRRAWAQDRERRTWRSNS
jgi:hypothetical protein